MPRTWKTVRVFISSTFRDMHAERDHVIKVTFPALREKLLPHRVELYDIDLRWGITEDEAKNERSSACAWNRWTTAGRSSWRSSATATAGCRGKFPQRPSRTSFAVC